MQEVNQSPVTAECGPAPSGPGRWVLAGLLLGVVAVWGWTFALVKEATNSFGVIPFLAMRFVIGAIVVAPFTAARAGRKSLAIGALVGLALAAGFLLQTLGLRVTSSTNSGLITGIFVVFVPLANRAIFGIRTPGTLWIGIAASVVGLYLLTAGGGAAGKGLAPPPGGACGENPAVIAREWGDFLTVLCAPCFGLHVALLDHFAKRHNPGALALGQLLLAAAAFLAAWPLIETPRWPPACVWPALLVTGLLATAAGYIIQTYAQRRLSAVEAAMIMVLEPLFAAGCGYLYGDRLTLLQIAGGVLMLAALAAVEVYPRWAKNRDWRIFPSKKDN